MNIKIPDTIVQEFKEFVTTVGVDVSKNYRIIDLTNDTNLDKMDKLGFVFVPANCSDWYLTDMGIKAFDLLVAGVSYDRDVVGPYREIALQFMEDFNKMSPRDKCTVHPPAGSGSGHGIYNKTNVDIFNEWFKNRIKSV